MGLYKRQRTWWMRFDYRGQTVRRTTGTTDRRLAESIFAKVRVENRAAATAYALRNGLE